MLVAEGRGHGARRGRALTEADAARVLRDNAAGLLGIGARLPELVEG